LQQSFDNEHYLKYVFVALLCIPNIGVNAKWIQNGISVAGSNAGGIGLNQLSNPHGVYVDDDQTIYVADFSNHRIVEWKRGATVGQVVAGGNGQGNQNNQLNGPTNVIVSKKNDCLIICDYGNKRVVKWPRRNGTNGETIISNVDGWGLSMANDEYIYVSDYIKHEVKRWKIGETNGTVVAGGNGAGSRLDQLNGPYHIFADQDHSVYVSDGNNHRVMKWLKGAKEGIVVAGSQGAGSGLTQLSSPYGVIVDQLGTVYVADYGNHRVMKWLKGATQGNVVVGGHGGGQANQFNGPVSLSFDQQNNLYVVDYHNHRVQKFETDSS
jgi:sugar lactone lactonase YvrE